MRLRGNAEGAGMAGRRLSGLHQHPAGMRTALLGDVAVIAVVARSIGRGNQAEAGGFVGRGETLAIAAGGQQCFAGGCKKDCVNAGGKRKDLWQWQLVKKY